MRGITEEEVEDWERDLKKGLTPNDLTKKYNRVWSVIQKRLRKEPNYRRLTDEELTEIKKLFARGYNQTEISKIVGTERKNVSYALKSTIRNKKAKELAELRKHLESLSDFDKGWIVGILEGEGCLYVTVEEERLRPRISISNVDKVMVDKVYELLPFMNYCTPRNREGWLTLYTVSAQHKKKLQVFCEVFIPYMICKKREMELLHQAINNGMDKRIVKELAKVKRSKNQRVKLR